MVGQRDVVASTGAINSATCSCATPFAAFCAAISRDSRRRRYVSRVDLVAGSDGHVPQTVALQATAAQMSSGTGRALLQHRYC